jgi:hypothetical protein
LAVRLSLSRVLRIADPCSPVFFSNFSGEQGYSKIKGGDPMINKKNIKLGAPSMKRNSFLNAKGGLDLIEKFVGVDYLPYEKKKIKKSKAKR